MKGAAEATKPTQRVIRCYSCGVPDHLARDCKKEGGRADKKLMLGFEDEERVELQGDPLCMMSRKGKERKF